MTSRAGTLPVLAQEEIRRRVLVGELTAGTPLSEEELAKDLNMSRTPVRQALQELARQGLLERVPGRGVTVSRIDIRQMLEIIELQQCLLEWCVPRIADRPSVDLAPVVEAYEAQLEGVEKGDFAKVLLQARQMDIALVTLAGNREMVQIMREISDLLVHAASQALSSKETLITAVQEHEEIIAALKERDAAEARKSLGRHFAGIRRRLLGAPE